MAAPAAGGSKKPRSDRAHVTACGVSRHSVPRGPWLERTRGNTQGLMKGVRARSAGARSEGHGTILVKPPPHQVRGNSGDRRTGAAALARWQNAVVNPLGPGSRHLQNGVRLFTELQVGPAASAGGSIPHELPMATA